MTQVRINRLIVLSDKTDSLNLYSRDQFVGSREGRLRVFGNYLENLCNYFCAILCFVHFFKLGLGGVWPYH